MIKSLVNVTCSERNKAVPYTGKVVGILLSVAQNYIGVDGDEYIFNFKYTKENGEYLISGQKVLTESEINAFRVSIESSLPASIDWTTDRKNEFYEAFKVEMASTFGIDTNQIENI